MRFLAQYIYKLILHTNNKILERMLLLLRRLLLKIANPIITLSYNNIKLAMPFSHTLPLNQKIYPTYDMQLHSIAQHIYTKDGQLNMIDVGANIGDTAVLTNIPNASYLLIEGERSYANLITTNIAYNFHKATISDISMGGGITRIFHYLSSPTLFWAIVMSKIPTPFHCKMGAVSLLMTNITPAFKSKRLILLYQKQTSLQTL